jgi:cytoskeletal protein RodZ
METVGIYLKKERESKNISLRELSRLSKISPLYLNFIEKDEFDKLPQGPYVKGYIASYSRLIGGDVDEAITLYEALNKKRIQTEEIQPDIPSPNGSNRLPEKPKTKAWKKPKGSRFGEVKSLFNTVVSSLPINRFSFKAAGTSIKNIGSSIRINQNWFVTDVSFFKKIALSWSWLNALIALLGIGILALAGFGFYHLFIYDPNPLPVAQLQHVQDKDARPLVAIDSEKSVLSSESTDASPTAKQLDEHASNQQHLEPASPPEAKKLATMSSTDPDATIPRTKSAPENSSGTSNPVIQTNTALSAPSSTAENPDSSRSTAGTESQVRSGQSELTAGPSPEPTTADADLNVLQASVCAEIKDRMPTGVDTSFPTSAQRVFVWSKIHAQQIPSKVRHIYFFDGQKISEVTLDVRSTYWRTWSFKNISNKRFQGEWRVDITSADGKVLRRLYFEVK